MDLPVENWNERIMKLKQKFEFLTRSGHLFDDSKKEHLFSKLQNKLGKSREEIQLIFETLEKGEM
jgi:hypothetical protein